MVLICDSLILKTFSLIAYALNACFTYNVVKFSDFFSLKMFVVHIMILGLALVSNIDNYLAEQEKQQRTEWKIRQEQLMKKTQKKSKGEEEMKNKQDK